MNWTSGAGRFVGARALVTGAGSGIGLATAGRLIAEGARVACIDRNADALHRILDQPNMSELVPIVADVRDEHAIRLAVTQASSALGGVPDVLVQCAAIYRFAPLLDMTSELWDEILETNLRGTFLVARALVGAAQAARQGGVIVNVASAAAYQGEAVEPKGAYGASKAGVLLLTRQMAMEWAPLGFRVNAVVPGAVDTPMLRLMGDPESAAAFLSGLPLHRVGRPEEIASAICFAASGDASYMTGSTLVVDGGLLAGRP